VANAGVGATYAWSATNGAITSGNNTPSVTFSAGAVGTMSLQVTVTTAAGCSDTKSVNVTVAVSPVTVTSVVPPAGKTAGGKPITVNGTGFLSGATITLGGSPATSVVFVNSTKLTAVTPAHAAGFVNVTVTNTNTTNGTLTNGYKYVTQQFDANNDTVIDPADVFYLVNYLFLSGPQPSGPSGMLSGDANGDNAVDPSDIFYVINYLFMAGPAPASEPTRFEGKSVAEPFAGAVTLGAPFQRDGRWVVPVSVSSAEGTELPRALSLRVTFKGDARNAVIHRTGATAAMEPGFEISRRTSNALAYLLSFEESKGRLSGVVAEIEFDARPNARVTIDVDPALTMLSNQAGTRRATVAAGTLSVSGTSTGSQQPLHPEKSNRE
jgi:PKD repeat protein